MRERSQTFRCHVKQLTYATYGAVLPRLRPTLRQAPRRRVRAFVANLDLEESRTVRAPQNMTAQERHLVTCGRCSGLLVEDRQIEGETHWAGCCCPLCSDRMKRTDALLAAIIVVLGDASALATRPMPRSPLRTARGSQGVEWPRRQHNRLGLRRCSARTEWGRSLIQT